jgi:hypothetical protein
VLAGVKFESRASTGAVAVDGRSMPVNYAYTWIRLQRMVEDAPTALVLLADEHVAAGPGGLSLALAATGPRWSGTPGPGRLLTGLGAQAASGRHSPRRADFLLRTLA